MASKTLVFDDYDMLIINGSFAITLSCRSKESCYGVILKILKDSQDKEFWINTGRTSEKSKKVAFGLKTALYDFLSRTNERSEVFDVESYVEALNDIHK